MTKLVIAHRGGSSSARENTLAAFEKAIELGSDMVEFDVRRIRDGTFVVHHDEMIGDGLLSNMSLETARSAAVRNGFDLPTLEETLLLLKNRIRLDIELKEEGYEQEVITAILAHFKPPDFCVTSFHDLSVVRIRRAFPEVRAGLLLGVAQPRTPILTRLSELFPEGRRRRIDANFLAPHYRLLRFGFLRRAARASDNLLVWTVDEPALMRFLLQQPAVAGVITNRPEVALEIRASLSEKRLRGAV